MSEAENPAAPTTSPTRRGRDWAWRRRIRANTQAYRAYRAGIALVGACVVVLGLVLVPLPGPGWLVVFLGVALWATEFSWAHRLHGWGVGRLRVWEAWVRRASWPARLALLVGTGAAVAACFWLVFFVTGLPGWLPTAVSAPLQTHLGL